MNQTIAFTAFMNLYHAVMDTPALSHAEKLAVLEVACDEYDNGAARPAVYRTTVRQLSDKLPKEPDGPSNVAPAPEHAATAKGRPAPVGPKPRR